MSEGTVERCSVREFPVISSFTDFLMGPIIAPVRQEENLTAVEKFDFSLEERGEDSGDALKAAFKDFHCA